VRVTCVGGGPAGLYFSLLTKLGDPRHDVTVLERTAAGTPRGWGVTMGREILDKIAADDPALARALEQIGVHRTRQVVHVGGERKTRDRYSTYNIPRKALVDVLAERAREVGVRISYGHEVTSAAELPPSDLIVAADGARSRLRSEVGGFGTITQHGSNKYIWLGSSAPFDAFSYIFAPTDHGWVWAYAYQFDAQTSTVIVECSPGTFAGLGLDTMPVPDGVALLSDLFKEQLTGHPLTARLPDGVTASWQSFPTVSNQRWHSGRVALIGDSAHTAHYSLGQGTKMALEDAAALAGALRRHADLETALTAFEAQRKSELMRPLSEARCSAQWFENLPRYLDLEPHQFAALLDSRWSPLVRVLPPLASYYLWQATERFTVLRGIRDRIGPAVKVMDGRRAITGEGLRGT
jgi:2-polyprenyl-6-methoxyphenol hydroxylase-like FAD-dependent oxidoreductase